MKPFLYRKIRHDYVGTIAVRLEGLDKTQKNFLVFSFTTFELSAALF
jgi:hypothetical protein